MIIYAGFILGFDGERAGAGQRIQAFVEQTSIPQPMLGILQAPPNTALWTRLEQEQRLLENADHMGGDQNTLMNFVPTRPLQEIGHEYVEALWAMYEPSAYLKRCLQHCLNITLNPYSAQKIYFSPVKAIRLVSRLIWRQGIRMAAVRAQFWRQLWVIVRTKPQFLSLYLGLCAAGEHFWEYRLLARARMTEQLGYDPLAQTPLKSLDVDQVRDAIPTPTA